jgi:putative membrane protein
VRAIGWRISRGTDRVAVAAFLLLGSFRAEAHAALPSSSSAWGGPPWLVATFALSIALYTSGVFGLWRHAGRGRGVSGGRVCCFVLGWLAAAVALLSPLDALTTDLFSAHMAQHELLMVVAAPLLVLGRPLSIWTWALPRGWRGAARSLAKARPVATAWSTLTRPVVATAVHGGALWLWHWPSWFDAAIDNAAIHTAQHLSFTITALFFWWAIAERPRASVTGGSGAAYLFVTMAHTSALGALLTFAPTVWYAAYRVDAPRWGLTPLEDQQIGGLIMWVPGGTVYAIAGLAIVARLLLRVRAPHRYVGETLAKSMPTLHLTTRSACDRSPDASAGLVVTPASRGRASHGRVPS